MMYNPKRIVAGWVEQDQWVRLLDADGWSVTLSRFDARARLRQSGQYAIFPNPDQHGPLTIRTDKGGASWQR